MHHAFPRYFARRAVAVGALAILHELIFDGLIEVNLERDRHIPEPYQDIGALFGHLCAYGARLLRPVGYKDAMAFHELRDL
jgi:hypothetical protein